MSNMTVIKGVEIRKDITICQHFMPYSVVVAEAGKIKFTSLGGPKNGTFGSFEEAAEFVKKTYGYSKKQIEILKANFEIDWDYWVPPVAYATQFPTIKKLPIAISDAKLQKWLKASQPFW